jgi:hypothetical protein
MDSSAVEELASERYYEVIEVNHDEGAAEVGVAGLFGGHADIHQHDPLVVRHVRVHRQFISGELKRMLTPNIGGSGIRIVECGLGHGGWVGKIMMWGMRWQRKRGVPAQAKQAGVP